MVFGQSCGCQKLKKEQTQTRTWPPKGPRGLGTLMLCPLKPSWGPSRMRCFWGCQLPGVAGLISINWVPFSSYSYSLSSRTETTFWADHLTAWFFSAQSTQEVSKSVGLWSERMGSDSQGCSFAHSLDELRATDKCGNPKFAWAVFFLGCVHAF